MRLIEKRPNLPRTGARGSVKDHTARYEAHAVLMGNLAELLRAGETVPCVSYPAGFQSDDEDKQRAAAGACLRCPALELCAAYVDQHKEPAGVWAGTTEKDREGKR